MWIAGPATLRPVEDQAIIWSGQRSGCEAGSDGDMVWA